MSLHPILSRENCPDGKVPNDWGTCVPDKPYDEDKGSTAVLIHGILSVCNSIIPMVLYFAWINRKNSADIKANHKTYRAAWRSWYISNLMIWLLPTLVWAFTLKDSDVPKYIFVNWFKWMYFPLWAATAITGILFFAAMIKSKNSSSVKQREVIIIAMWYYAWSAVNIYFNIIELDNLIQWYPNSWSEARDSYNHEISGAHKVLFHDDPFTEDYGEINWEDY